MLETATPEELKRLTGLERPSAIKRFLTQQQIPYMVGADGWPRVYTLAAKAGLVGAQDPRLHLVAPFNFSQVRAPAMPSMPVMRTMRASTSSSGGGFKLAAIQPAACMPFQPHTSSG